VGGNTIHPYIGMFYDVCLYFQRRIVAGFVTVHFIRLLTNAPPHLLSTVYSMNSFFIPYFSSCLVPSIPK
jgi:hypothetical protein